jgi:ADP-ribose pyrophosphatase YjhB (NUDIX family)
MGFEPQKFFIGIMDFFTILMPGALLAYLVMDPVGETFLGARYKEIQGAEALLVFLFASYLLGHLIFLLSSWFDEFYDWARRHTLNKQIMRLAHQDKLATLPLRILIWLVFKGERDIAVDRAGKIRQQALKPLQAKDAINTFQWCKAWLNDDDSESLAVIQRFEADSKFFRCLALVAFLIFGAWFTASLLEGIFAVWPWQDQWHQSGITVVLSLLVLVLAASALFCAKDWPARKRAVYLGLLSILPLALCVGSLLRLGTDWSWPTHLPRAPIPAALGLSLLAILSILALWRYMEQRHKATNQAYWSVITLTAKRIPHKPEDKADVRDKSPAEITAPGRAGGVVLRSQNGKREILLVRANTDAGKKKDSARETTKHLMWVLPKGEVEEGEWLRETAVRRVHEETGVWASIVGDIGDVIWWFEGKTIVTRFFIMEKKGYGLSKSKGRESLWVSIEELLPDESRNEGHKAQDKPFHSANCTYKLYPQTEQFLRKLKDSGQLALKA